MNIYKVGIKAYEYEFFYKDQYFINDEFNIKIQKSVILINIKIKL